jgi:hypothetical protein
MNEQIQKLPYQLNMSNSLFNLHHELEIKFKKYSF